MAKPTTAPRRDISDARVARALAHPTRLALLDLLRHEGELTASRAAELLHDSPGNMSWHLQTLAKYGFIEEAEGAKGRSRPWRRSAVTTRFLAGDDHEAVLAGDALEALLLERSLEQRRAWKLAREAYPPAWRHSAFLSDSVAYLTPKELEEIAEAVAEVYRRFIERNDPALRPDGVLPVSLTAYGHPLTGPASGDSA